LEGSEQQSGDRVRVNAQLIEAETGAHLWAERYDGPLGDIFTLQDQITIAVVGAIEPSVRAAEIERVKRKRPDSLDAYDMVLRAWPLLYSRMPEDAAKAIPLFEQAIERDPDYALAHAALAWCLHARFYRGGLNPEDDARSVRHAKTAAACGTDDATATAIAAFVLSTAREHDHATAAGLYERALELSPSCTLALGYGGATLCVYGKYETAIHRAQIALQLSPFDPFRYAPCAALSMAYFLQGRYEEAAVAARRAIESNPRFSFLHTLLAAALAQLNLLDEARAVGRQVLALQPDYTVASSRMVWYAPQFAPYLDGLRQAGLPE
jgi:adenylate cyclase